MQPAPPSFDGTRHHAMNEPTDTPTADVRGLANPRPPAVSARTGVRGLARVQRFLASAPAPRVLLAVALLLTSCVLTLKLTADDYIHLVGVRPEPGVAGLLLKPWDLFAFARGDAASARGLMDEGVFPWWSDPTTVLSFFRPLSSLTHWVDYALWPERLALIHFHSLLWYALLLVVVARVYRRLVPIPWVASLALWIYALDDARAPAAGWVATRNLLIGMTFAMLALDAHVRARREASRWSRWLAPVWLALGFLGGESAVQGGCYLLGYALFLERGSLLARLKTLAPYALVLIAWRVPYSLLGHGARGSGLYFDPGREPLAFLQAASTRLPVLLLSEFGLPGSDLWDALPVLAAGWEPAYLAWAALVIVVSAVLLAPILRRDPVARFWALGALLSSIPVCAGPIDDRLLLGPGIGFGALLAQLFVEVYEGTYPRAGKPVRLLVGALAALHLILAPLMLPLRAAAIDTFETYMQRADAGIPRDPSIRTQSVVAINPPVDLFAMYFPCFREAHGVPRPKYLRWLANGVEPLDITRLDAHTLRVRPEHGFLVNSTQLMLRGRGNPMHLGEKVVLSDATFTVTELTDDKRPAEVEVRFVAPLESPSLRFVRWEGQSYVPFELPAVGQTVHVPAVDMKRAMLGD
ncbi:MAG: hypothetical protein ABW252_21705 [Polyangiales bacterium]